MNDNRVGFCYRRCWTLMLIMLLLSLLAGRGVVFAQELPSDPEVLLEAAMNDYYQLNNEEAIQQFRHIEELTCGESEFADICLQANLFGLRSRQINKSISMDEWVTEYRLWSEQLDDWFLEKNGWVTLEEWQRLQLKGLLLNVKVLTNVEQEVDADQIRERIIQLEARGKFSEYSEMHRRLIHANVFFEQGLFANVVEEVELFLQGKEVNSFGIHGVSLRTDLTQILGSSYTRLGQNKKAMEWFLQDVDMLRSQLPENHRFLISAIGNVGMVHYLMGNYASAVEYYISAISIQESQKNISWSSMAVSLRNLATCYFSLGEYGLAGEYLEQAQIALVKSGDGETYTMSMTYGTIAELYKINGDMESAERSFKKSLEIRMAVLGPDHPEMIRLRINISNFYRSVEKFQEAKEMLEDARRIANLYYEDTNPIFLEIDYQRARLEFDMGSFEKAQETLNQALLVAGAYNDNQSYSEVADPVMAMNALLLNTSISRRLFDTTGAPSHLERGLEISDQGISLLEHMQSNLGGDESAADFHHLYYSAYTTKLDLLYRQEATWNGSDDDGTLAKEKEWMNQVFEVMERSRSRLASVLLNELESEVSTGLPEELFTERRNLYQTQMELRQKLLGMADSTESNSVILQLRQQLLQNQEQMNRLQRNIAEQYPDYYAQMINRSVPKVQDVQRELRPDEVMVIYTISELNVFALVVQKEDVQIRNLSDSKSLKARMQVFQGLMGRLNSLDPEEQETLRISLEELYETLLTPIEEFIVGKDLLVSPDQELHYLPFDLLLTEPSNLKNAGDWPYLIRRQSVSIIQSSKFWLMRSEEREAPENEFLGMAPFSDFQDGDGLMEQRSGSIADFTERSGAERGAAVGTEGSEEPSAEVAEESDAEAVADTTRGPQAYAPLLMSAFEISRIDEIVQSGRTGNRLTANLLGSDATEANFLSANPGSYRFLHFATHAEVVDSDPSLSNLLLYSSGGDPQRLYAGDVYGLQLSADLVVLSACETALGEYRKGDGLVGFTRAFFYAGAKNVISSMWKVNDRSTALFMIELYESIAEGYSYRESLRLAKLAMLENPQFNHPYYWAVFHLQEGFR